MLNKRKREACSHNVYIKGLCGNCGIRLDPPQSTSVSMIHSVPELKVSEEYAKEIGEADQQRLIRDRKLVLLVDLDQTVLHTTHEKVKGHSNVHSFELWPGHPTYYTKLRPHLEQFLEQMSKIYELHIFTFGCRMYAHKIASIIDPKQKYFGHRILSRDESVDQYSKKGNLNNLFPCGDAMVCIIDDRADVWGDAGNLIQVKPYSYFKTSISDGAMQRNNSFEDDETLDEHVHQLEALLEVENCDNDNEVVNQNGDAENGNVCGDITDGGVVQCPENIKTEVENQIINTVKDVRSATNILPSCSGEETVSEKEGQTSEIDGDFDDHLLYLPVILSRIHEKWYMELDEQRQFLIDGESYKLPDIKDIIRRYLRKRYH